MKIRQLIKGIRLVKALNLCWDKNISGLSCDSRQVKDGDAFVAIRGPLRDGHDYIDDAIKRGADLIVIEDRRFLPEEKISVSYIQVRNSRAALSKMADAFFGNPYQKVKFIGITGTNGKTTVLFLIRSVLEAAGIKCGSIGTLGYRIKKEDIALPNTTPGIIELHLLVKKMVKAGNTHILMEVSSHALDQDRIYGAVFHRAVFTNLTQDHLDYHKTKQKYFRAKQKLFAEYMNPKGCSIINKDSPFGKLLLDMVYGRTLTYGFSADSDVNILHSRSERGGSNLLIQTPKGPLNLSTALIGKHNFYNILAAVAFGISERVSLEVIKQGIEEVFYIPGRLERIDSKMGFSVFIDYAHTEDALKNVLECLRTIIHNGRVITVFGCGGDRDTDKRPKMAKVASTLSDYCIITSDNPRSEDPRAIIQDIVHGMVNDNFEVQVCRRTAIRKVLLMAGRNDAILIAGKGHESIQILKKRTVPFSDKGVALEMIAEMEKDV